MDRTKPVQEGVRVKLPAGKTWEALAAMSPEQIREQNAFPKGFYPLPHPKHSEGGEFYREICDFGTLRDDFVGKNRCAAGTSRAIPYAN